jgi:hypothetical protein
MVQNGNVSGVFLKMVPLLKIQELQETGPG